MVGTDTASTDMTTAASWPTVKQGHRGRDVTTVQALLRSYGYSLDVDGVVGAQTWSARTSLQRSLGLTADGVVGRESLRRAALR